MQNISEWARLRNLAFVQVVTSDYVLSLDAIFAKDPRKKETGGNDQQVG